MPTPDRQETRSAATPSALFDDADLGEPTNDRERVLLAEIARLRKERDEAVESSHYYLAEYKRVYGELADSQKPKRPDRPLDPPASFGEVGFRGLDVGEW